MKKTLCILASLGMVWAAPYASAQEPQNISVVKKTLVQYHDSGEYNKDIKAVIEQANSYLRDRVSHNPDHKKLAIVLDIDETSLSNYDDMVTLRFGGTLQSITEAADKGKDPVIEPTLKLYNYAKAADVSVFFITGRKEEERAVTAANLREAGYDHWDKLYLRDGEYKHVPAAVYKTAIRKELVAQGYDIVENIGDQQSDLEGGFSDKNFKLPNPYYYIP